jgi:hypothetical protein
MVFELGVPMFRIVFYCRKSHGTTRKRLWPKWLRRKMGKSSDLTVLYNK